MRVDIHKELHSLDLDQEVSQVLGKEYYSFSADWSVKESLEYLRKQKEEVRLRYFYVVNEANKLLGVVSSHQLAVNSDKTKISTIMAKDPLTIPLTTPLKEAVRLLKEYQLVAIPVVDNKNTLAGVIEFQVSKDRYKSEEEHSLHVKKSLYNDIFQLIGVSVEEAEAKKPLLSFSKRMPWLFGNILAGLTCAAIANTFQLVLQTAIILAMFIPLVLTLSESISIQAMAMSINILHAKKVRFKDVLNRIAIESKTAMLLGLTAGLVVEFLAIILHTNELPFLVISVSIFTSMTLTSCLGVLLPVILHQLRLDPKIAGGPVVLMFADVVATAIYLGLATWWIL